MSRTKVAQSLQQMSVVLRFEIDKEKNTLNAFNIAQQYHQQQKAKLASLQQYRLEYMRQLQQEGGKGVGARHYQQKLSFVAKLDKACEQQNQIIAQASVVASQRKRQWLTQQRKRQAVEKLIDKKQGTLVQLENRQEQQLNDEFALQRILRNQYLAG
ncbi:flagellar export protein FliJ [Aestuariibacter sp. GS-14]|uniref:flagellar export protein FliJ n=1 Tax=Aestuariibacter sp. GS-14 TaxID=2590670 RepID=UPI00112A1BCD|nr:flagellar export protein FliJ [Aestuariibacter sp. GS-14]TPV61923.1 flagellar export protein FliJ [Aestuariibacter sp. GS-14]